MQFKMLEKYF